MRNNLELWRSRSPWTLFEDVDNLLRAVTTPNEGQVWNLNPATDIVENEDHFLVSVDLPGVSKEDVKIEVVGESLTISGERRYEKKNDRRSEKSFGKFERSFSLPNNVDTSKIEARYENGVLELALPKVEAAKPRTIEVQTGKGLFGRLLGPKATEHAS